MIGISLDIPTVAALGGANASQFAPYPAPTGYRWEFVTSNGERVTSAENNNQPVVALVQNS